MIADPMMAEMNVAVPEIKLHIPGKIFSPNLPINLKRLSGEQ